MTTLSNFHNNDTSNDGAWKQATLVLGLLTVSRSLQSWSLPRPDFSARSLFWAAVLQDSLGAVAADGFWFSPL